MHHVWAATAAAVVSVAATGTAAALQANAASKAAKSQAAAQKKATRQEKKSLKGFTKGQQQIEADLGQIPMPVRDPEANMREAERITGYNREQLNRFYGGQYKNLEDLAVRAINDRLSGQMTQSAREATMRESAYMQGAGFNPATARAGAIAQRGPFDYLRAIGQSTEQAVTQGFNMMGDWTNLVRGFIESPLRVSQDSLAYQMGAANAGLEKVGIKSNLIAAQYGAQLGQTQRGLTRQQEQIATNLALDQQRAEMIQKIGESVSSGASAAGGAYSKYAAAKGGGGGIVSGYGGQQYAPQTSATGGQYYSAIGGAFK